MTEAARYITLGIFAGVSIALSFPHHVVAMSMVLLLLANPAFCRPSR